jgi:hypothetical protein
MTQPIDIITRALSAIGAGAPGETVDPSLAQDALNMLNMLIDSSSNDAFAVTSINEIIAPIAGATDWTIGPSGTITSTQRPLTINSAFVRVSTIDYPVAILNVEQYELIGLKQLNGPWPRALWYNSGTPNGLIKFWPLPSSGEIHLFCDLLLTSFATINDTVVLPQGYELWLTWGLAELLCPGYGKLELIGVCKSNAARALGALKSTNMSPMQTVQFDPAMGGRNRAKDAGWIYSGGFR